MNFADIESVWQSPDNQPGPDQLAQAHARLIRDLRRRRRVHLLFLGVVLFVLTLFTVRVVLFAAGSTTGSTPFDFAHEWAVAPLLVLPWAGWLVIVMLHRRQAGRHPDFSASVQASVAASLDANRNQRQRYRVVGGLLLASVPVLALAVLQLQRLGKAGPELNLPAFVLWPAYVGLMALAFAVHDHRVLRVRQLQLQALWDDYRVAA